ncbi:VOC family protein [Paenibacillus sp. strain BS8-2]
MFNKVGQIMLYVNDQDKAKSFWTEVAGFDLVAEEDNGEGFRWIEVAPKGADTTIILHNKEFVAKMNPGMNLGTPSLMFFTQSLDELYASLKERDIFVGDIVALPGGRVFNFADYEENYFAVMERN